ncbi:antigen 5 like allergen Cul n 1-like [Phlebotomus argentipes]|uniref:antigen 5 like allergen Cul n 1-like n=1 Tax=Phlebotomus argentipes TaxID=94469 RepID=UPI002892FAAA|nr:antigen 5 like allergen Cul n 1-like [Phlebotomus argentipes]
MGNSERILLLFLRVFLFGASVVNCVDWCAVEKEFCRGQQHIACKHTKFPQGSCANVKIVKMDEDLVRGILHRHNYYRNDIAQGLVGKYPQAEKMQQMAWDDELAFLATEHVKHCNFDHDGCRATPDYPHAGQNLGFHATTGHLEPLVNISSFMIDEWFAENTLLDESVVSKFERSDLKGGHFTVMVNEKNNRVGCAMITYNYHEDSYQWNAVLLTCNYAKTNILNRPIYTPGSPLSGCHSIGKAPSKEYEALCAP